MCSENGGKGKAITEVQVLSKDTEDTASCRKDMEVDSQDLLGNPVNNQIYSLMTDPAVQGQNALTCVDLTPQMSILQAALTALGQKEGLRK